MLKHATSSVYLFHQPNGPWRLGLIHHPRLHHWMLPGGHQEDHENPLQTALREVAEETGRIATLINTHAGALTGDLTVAGHSMLVPMGIVEQHVPSEARHPHPHIHIDHLYVAVTNEQDATMPAELPFDWFTDDALDHLDMFHDTRSTAHTLFAHIDRLTHHHTTQAATTRTATGA